MRLDLRDRLAEWILEALADPARDAPIHAVAAFARAADSSGVARELAASDVAALGGTAGLFESSADGIRLRGDLLRDLPALRTRSARFLAALAAARERCGSGRPRGPAHAAEPSPDELQWTLCAAAALFDAGLFFEVHELLEPLWRRAGEPLRIFLQGLIQVAVGLHHHENRNLRGAVSLLEDGLDKLRPQEPAAFGVELADFDTRIAAITEALRARPDSPPPPPPPLVVSRAHR